MSEEIKPTRFIRRYRSRTKYRISEELFVQDLVKFGGTFELLRIYKTFLPGTHGYFMPAYRVKNDGVFLLMLPKRDGFVIRHEEIQYEQSMLRFLKRTKRAFGILLDDNYRLYLMNRVKDDFQIEEYLVRDDITWKEVTDVCYPMFSMSTSVFDEEGLLHELHFHYKQGLHRGLENVFTLKEDEPKTLEDYVRFFRSVLLPYQLFERSPQLTYSFVPDVDTLAEEVLEDSIGTVPSIADIPQHAEGFYLVINKESLMLVNVEKDDSYHLDIIWKANPGYAKLILDKAREEG